MSTQSHIYQVICTITPGKQGSFNIQRPINRGDLQDGGRVRRGNHLTPHKYIRIHLHVEQLLQNTYWMLAETSDLPKGKKLSTYLGRAKEKRKKQRQKNTDGTFTSGREL